MGVYTDGAFSQRVSHAAHAFVRNSGIGTRHFDTCFEMHDGDAVVTALVRRSRKNEALRRGIESAWAGKFPEGWTKCAEKYASEKNLTELARRLRTSNEVSR